MRAYREAPFVRAALMESVFDQNVVIQSIHPYHGDEYPDDGTEEVAHCLGAKLIKGSWKIDSEQLNDAMDTLDCDYFLNLDPDEFLTKADQVGIMKYCEKFPWVSAFRVSSMKTYWKDGYVIDPPEPYKPMIVVRKGVHFKGVRDVDCFAPFLPDEYVLHHFSWVRSDESVKRKLKTYCHAAEVLPGWYQRYWLNWTENDRDFHPTQPDCYKRAIKTEVPDEFRKYVPTFL